MTGKPIHIALTFDDNFWAPAYATMRSVCLATRRRRDLNFHLCHLGLTERHRADLLRIVEEFGARLHWYDMNDVPRFVELSAKARASKRWPRIVYARLLFPEFLPADVERVIYLDCDVYVRAPIEQLAERDMEGHPVAAVSDSLFPFVALGRDLGVNRDLFDAADPYFNSGVLLIDRKAWAEMGIVDRFAAAIADGTMARVYYDQDFLNLVFRNNWLQLEPFWNTIDPRKAHEALNPHILHYTDRRKPWNLVSGVAFSRVYRHVMTNELFYRYMRHRARQRLQRFIPAR